MNKWQEDVLEFHKEMDLLVGDVPPEIRRPELRAELILEEAKEVVEALTGVKITGVAIDPEPGQPSLLEAIDGLIDLIVVSIGTAIEMGIDLDPFWDEVQRANMAKAGGPKRDDGKQLKPEGWVPPDHAKVLRERYGVYINTNGASNA